MLEFQGKPLKKREERTLLLLDYRETLSKTKGKGGPLGNWDPSQTKPKKEQALDVGTNLLFAECFVGKGTLFGVPKENQ